MSMYASDFVSRVDRPPLQPLRLSEVPSFTSQPLASQLDYADAAIRFTQAGDPSPSLPYCPSSEASPALGSRKPAGKLQEM